MTDSSAIVSFLTRRPYRNPEPHTICWQRGRKSGTAMRRGANSSSTRLRPPSLPPTRHFVGHLTRKSLEKGAHVRRWHYCHGRAVFHDCLDEQLPCQAVSLLRRCHLPGACHVSEECGQALATFLRNAARRLPASLSGSPSGGSVANSSCKVALCARHVAWSRSPSR